MELRFVGRRENSKTECFHNVVVSRMICFKSKFANPIGSI